MNYITDTLPGSFHELLDPRPGNMVSQALTPVLGGFQGPDVRTIVQTKRAFSCGSECPFPGVPSCHENMFS